MLLCMIIDMCCPTMYYGFCHAHLSILRVVMATGYNILKLLMLVIIFVVVVLDYVLVSSMPTLS